MSLGTWFREYVYIPLGGNRHGKARQCLNLLIVWGLTGLWHGASWNFVVWGLYFALLLMVEKFLLLPLLKKAPAVVSHVYTMFFVIVSWVIFDFTNTSQMVGYIGKLFSVGAGLFSSQALYQTLAHLPLLAVAVFACLPVGRRIYDKVAATRMGWALDAVGVAAALLLCTAALVSSTYNPFLYFRF